MFGFGFSEWIVIGLVAMLVIKPEDLPKVFRKLGEWSGKAQRFYYAITDELKSL